MDGSKRGRAGLAAVLGVLLLAGCAAPPCAGLAGAPMLTAELYFGRMAGGARIDEAAWRGFLADVVTPRFPSGFTVLDGYGQWRQRATGRIASEPSTVVVVVAEPGPATLAALEAIRAEYRRRFAQESVGLALTESCASF
jgi:hypothetical protein